MGAGGRVGLAMGVVGPLVGRGGRGEVLFAGGRVPGGGSLPGGGRVTNKYE